MDSALTHATNALAGRSAVLDALLIATTKWGIYAYVGLVAVRWFARIDGERERWNALRAGLATLLALGVNQVVLLFVHRARPYTVGLTHLLISPSSDPSFPSDHATVALAVAATLLLSSARFRWPMLAFGLLICFSRVYVGTHYVTDIVGGAAIGTVAAVIVHLVRNGIVRLASPLVRLPWPASRAAIH